MEREKAIELVLAGFDQVARNGAKFNSPFEGYAAILDRFDGAWAKIRSGRMDAAQEEIVQVAVQSLRFLTDFGRYGCICCADGTCDEHLNQDHGGDYGDPGP